MDTFQDVENQWRIEEYYSKKGIQQQINQFINDDDSVKEFINKAIEYVDIYKTKEYYPSKNKRIEEFFSNISTEDIVNRIISTTLECVNPEMLVSVVSIIALGLKHGESIHNIKTVGEILAVICETDAYDIATITDSGMGSFYVRSNIQLPKMLLEHMNMAEYLPPMLCEPLELTNNNQSGYLSFNDSVILGKRLKHDEDVCLDVLNKINKVQLSLNTEFLSQMEEEPKTEPETEQQKTNWQNFKEQSHKFYKLMNRCGNKFYFTHRVDRRGRIYSQGYHINYQGASYKKAMLEFANKEIVSME